MGELTLSVEYHTSTAASQGLVGCSGHYMAVFKGGRHHTSCHEPTDMCHVCHEVRPIVIRNLPQPCIVQVPGVATGPCDRGDDTGVSKMSRAAELASECTDLQGDLPIFEDRCAVCPQNHP